MALLLVLFGSLTTTTPLSENSISYLADDNNIFNLEESSPLSEETKINQESNATKFTPDFLIQCEKCLRYILGLLKSIEDYAHEADLIENSMIEKHTEKRATIFHPKPLNFGKRINALLTQVNKRPSIHLPRRL